MCAAHTCLGVGPSTGVWLTYQDSHLNESWLSPSRPQEPWTANSSSAGGAGSWAPGPSVLSDDCFCFDPGQVLWKQPYLLWVPEVISPLISSCNCFALGLRDHWLLRSFYFLFNDGPWAPRKTIHLLFLPHVIYCIMFVIWDIPSCNS